MTRTSLHVSLAELAAPRLFAAARRFGCIQGEVGMVLKWRPAPGTPAG